MGVVPQKDLRNNVGEILRRAEAGEEMTITVSGRPVARLGPPGKPQWISGEALRRVFTSPAPCALEADLARFPASLVDPFAS